MIDSFWTKWRLRQLAGGETLLAGKWLEDYARWIYGKLWYRCPNDHEKIQKLLEDIFVSAAGRLNEYPAGMPMSDWLYSIYKQFTDGYPVGDKVLPTSPELRNAISSLSTKSLSGTESFWPELAQFSQQALSMLSCDEQRLLMSRYFHLERRENTAAQYGHSLSEIQMLLYRASHSFRRILETLTQAGTGESWKTGQFDPAILEGNLEIIIRSLVLESPTPDFMAQLKDHIVTVLSQNRPTGWKGAKRKVLCATGGICVLAMVMMVFILSGKSNVSQPGETKAIPQSTSPAKNSVVSASGPDAAQQVQMAVQMGTAGDIEGLLGLLRTGSYPAQVAAAHYLGLFGDKSAINLLDQASQKWHAESPAEKNPFVEAIAAIENRMRQQIQRELEAAQKQAAKKLEDEARLKQQSIPAEPNRITIIPPKSPVHEPNIVSEETEEPEPLLIVHLEPNQPPVIEEFDENPPADEPNEPSMIEDANQTIPIEDIELQLYENPNL